MTDLQPSFDEALIELRALGAERLAFVPIEGDRWRLDAFMDHNRAAALGVREVWATQTDTADEPPHAALVLALTLLRDVVAGGDPPATLRPDAAVEVDPVDRAADELADAFARGLRSFERFAERLSARLETHQLATAPPDSDE